MSNNPNPPPPGQPSRPGQPLPPGHSSGQMTTGGSRQPHRPTIADATLELTTGARPLPDYELTHLLGKGGFGQVWRAKGPGGFTIALKFIPLGEQNGAVEMRSLELMREIRHPHLLTMFGAWQLHGYLIIAMELADQTTYDYLTACMKQGWPGTPPDKLLDFMREAAYGIDHLNSLGIQHRDIKPQNLLLVGGSVKVADFGLAKVMSQTNASQTGQQTLAYAAPEFFQGKVSPQSDQYSLAVSYCHLRANQLPFAGGMAEMLSGHLMRQPNLAYLPTPAERNVLARALAKNPAERWPSCAAFVQALHAALHQSGPPPMPTSVAQTQGNYRPKTAALQSHTQPLDIDEPALVEPPPGNRTLLYALAAGVAVTMVTAGLTIGYLLKPTPTNTTEATPPEQQQADAGKVAREQAAAHLDKKDYARALASYDTALKLNAKDAEALAGKGRVKLAQRKYDEAIDECNKALEVNAQFAPALQVRAGAYLEKAQLERAAEDARKAAELKPDLVAALLILAQVQARLTAFDAALVECQKAIDKAPKDARVWAARAEVYLAREQFSPAIDDFDKAVELDGKSAEYLVRRAHAKVLRDGPGAGKDDWTKAVALFQPATARDFVERARVQVELLQFKEALEDADRAVDRDPQEYEAYSVRADVYQAQGERDKAIAERHKAIGCLGQPQTAPEWLARAKLYDDCGDYEKAISDCNEAIKRVPRYAEAYFVRAHLYHGARGDDKKALSDWDEALRLAPNAVAAHFERAIVLVDLEDPEQATRVLERIQQLADSKYALSHARRATLYNRMGQYEQGLEAARTALERCPKCIIALQARATALAYLNRTVDMAVADLDRAIDLEPHNLELRVSRATVLRLNKQPDLAKRDLDEYLRRTPHTYAAHLHLGRHFELLYKWPDAVSSYTRAISVYAQGADALLSRAVAHNQKGDTDKARLDYDSAVRLQPALMAGYYQRGLLSFNLARYDESLTDLDQALTLHVGGKKKKAMILNYQGRCYHLKRDYTRAIEFFTQSMNEDPSFDAPYNNRAISYAKLGKRTQALEDLSRALKLKGEDALYHANAAYVYYELQEYPTALSYYKKAIDLERNTTQRASYHRDRGDVYLASKDYQAARDDYAQAALLDPLTADYPSSLGMAYVKLKDWDRAIDAQAKAMQLANSNYWKAYYANRRANAYADRAEEALGANRTDDAKRDFERAADDYKEAIKLQEQNATFHANLGYAYAGLGKEPECIASYTKAIDREQDKVNKAGHYYDRGRSYHRSKQLTEALADFKMAVRTDPSRGVYHYWQAQTHFDREEWRNAIDAYTEAIRLYQGTTQRAICYQFRGCSHYKLNDSNKALEDLNTSIQLDGNRWGSYADRAEIYESLKRPEDAKRDRARSEELKKK